MSASELNIRILLRIKAVAEAKGIGDPTRLAEISGLPISIAESLWNQPSQNQDLKTIVAVAIALGSPLQDLVEVTRLDEGERNRHFVKDTSSS
jgi:hypothetical protein